MSPADDAPPAPSAPLWARASQAALQSPQTAVALAAGVWVGASLLAALATIWWQATQSGGFPDINGHLLAPAVGFAAVSFGLRTLRWHVFLGAAGARPSLRTSARAQLIGFSLTMTPGKIGEVYKCFLIEQSTGVPAARTAPIVLLEKLMDALAFCALALLAAATLSLGGDPLVAAARSLAVVLSVAAVSVIVIRRSHPDRVASLVLRLLGRYRLGRRIASAAGLVVAGSVDLVNRRLITRGALLSLGARTCDGLCLAWTMWALGIDLPALVGIFALNSSGALGGLSMLPGGIGVVEASMSVVLAGFGAPASAALAATLAVRLFTFWAWVAIGLTLLVRAGFASEG